MKPVCLPGLSKFTVARNVVFVCNLIAAVPSAISSGPSDVSTCVNIMMRLAHRIVLFVRRDEVASNYRTYPALCGPSVQPRKSKLSCRALFTKVFASLSVSPSLVITAFVHAMASSADFVTPGPGCRISEGAIAGCHEENQLCGLPVPARDHSSGDMALPSVHPQLARRRGFVGGTRSGGVLRDGSALGEPFRTADRGRLAKAPAETPHDLLEWTAPDGINVPE